MQTQYKPSEFESKIYALWDKGGYFSPDYRQKSVIRNSKFEIKPFTILLPPPNASGKMHTGNVLMIAIEDLLIRWKRMQGYAALWVPGTDHAGFETQITFEKKLKKEGKSRFDYDRETLYHLIWDFVHNNKSEIEGQLRSMGASVDWSRYTFTLDDKVIRTVHDTFEKMYKEGLVYRDNYMVNYCPKCGTTFADLEVKYVERKDPLYYLKYGPFELATVRPETKFGDTAVAVNPQDKRYKKYIGKEIEVEGLLGTFKLTVIADNFVDPAFGTGVVKVTPAHDKNDYEAGKRHNLPIKQAIGLDGRMTTITGPYAGLTVFSARKKVVEDLTAKNLITKIDSGYVHTVATCYKAGHDIEPMIVPNWFIKVDDKKKSLKKPAYDIVKKGKVKIYPQWREITYLRWMEEMHDWPISRQVVWGIRIPAWYSVDDNPDIQVTFLTKKTTNGSRQTVTGLLKNVLKDHSLADIEEGLQNLFAPANATFVIATKKPGDRYLPETDTFDTWFSSGQWPLVTLGYPDSPDFARFYPTDVMETGWEIIRLWVSRMIMFGLYATGKPPFHSVYLHGIVRARDGKKMSKSLGNVINPDEYQDKYGTDALRMGLISGTAGGKDFNFPHDKVLAYQKFANKLWNMGRFIEMQNEDPTYNTTTKQSATDKAMVKKLNTLIQKTNKNLEKYRFAQAAEDIYHFTWHEVADKYIEHIKEQKTRNSSLVTLNYVYSTCLKLLHPFMPFVTEAIWQELPKEITGATKPLIVEDWPQ